jgi:hypothetical protein
MAVIVVLVRSREPDLSPVLSGCDGACVRDLPGADWATKRSNVSGSATVVNDPSQPLALARWMHIGVARRMIGRAVVRCAGHAPDTSAVPSAP